MSFEQPSDYEQWLDAQFYSLEATKNIDFKIHLQALDKTKQPAVLESIWKSINQVSRMPQQCPQHLTCRYRTTSTSPECPLTISGVSKVL